MKVYTVEAKDLYEEVKNTDNQVIAHLNLKKGQEVPTHNTPHTVVVVIYSGEVEFTGEDCTAIIKPGNIIELKPDENHSLKGLEDSKLVVIKSHLK